MVTHMTEEQDIARAADRRRQSTAKLKCAICGEKIVGKAWRIDENKYACTRCNNEQPGV
jgi:formylmethanofuran dehydrogenase subunit E